MWRLREKALAELDWGAMSRHADHARALEERSKLDHDPNAALAYGRALLANGRAQEALEPLRMAYGGWLSGNQPRSAFAAETEYWLESLDRQRRGQARPLDDGRGPDAHWLNPRFRRIGHSCRQAEFLNFHAVSGLVSGPRPY